ncbi:MAG: orotidine-5'-phosphate decarboxylase [Candidatus Eisenbacteria bacterium]|nr:orotidine-5'-phosphate decarboxylase [Candidatus Eisenbacteria bacterium]
MTTNGRDSLILALDVATEAEALELAAATGEHVGCMKVGLRLFTSAGPGLVRRLRTEGHRVFLDLKFHDIPNTVADASRAATALGVDYFTVHTPGGPEMLKASLEAAWDEAARLGTAPPVILAVTVLTSLPAPESEVVRRAAAAWEAGIRGVVASPREARALRETLGPEATIVTPGVRPSWAAADDQRRVATPADAISAGATHIVVGRPITTADEPREAARRVREEIEEAHSRG